MAELIENAWLGWKNYISEGKLAAVFLMVLLFLWFGKKRVEQKTLLLYTTVIAFCCTIPVTAAALMAYQTRFYDYEWIWSMVPITAVTAWGIVIFLWEVWPDLKGNGWRKGLPVVLLVLGMVLLCGSMGSKAEEAGYEKKEDKIQAQKVLELVKDEYSGEELCLWAPREIMEYIREADASVRLPYGRDMWDSSLNGYTYDVYSQEVCAMYHRMEEIAAENQAMQEAGIWEDDPWEICAGYAAEAGVNCILIPDRAASETIEALEKALHAEARKLEGYWIFYGWAD